MKMNNIMKQAAELQKKLKEQQEELATKSFEASTGGGMVTAVVNGRGELLSVKIDREVVNPEDVEMLQDLLVSAVNQALGRVQEAQQDEMSNMMGGLGLKIPGMF